MYRLCTAAAAIPQPYMQFSLADIIVKGMEINTAMKKILTFIVCVAMLLSLTVIGISADASFTDTKPDSLGTLILEKGAAKEDVSAYEGDVINLADGGESFCCKAGHWVSYDFTADVAGTYTFVVQYIAREGNERAADYAIDSTDESARVTLDLEQSNDTRYAIITEDLDAGDHSFYWFAPTGFDDSNLKSCDFYNISIYLTAEAAPETEAAASDDETAPQTADITVIATVVLAVSATAAIIVTGKRH